LEEYRTSFDLRSHLDDKQGMAYCLKYIGMIYERQDSILLSKIHYKQSLDLFTQQDDAWGIASLQYLLGNIYYKEGKIDSALALAELSLANSQALGYPANIRDAAQLLTAIYRSQQNWEAALKMNDLFIRMRDSVQNDDTRKIVLRNKFQSEFEKKELLLEAQAEQEISEQRMQRNAFIGGFILVLLLVIVIYSRYKIKTAANVELGKKNEIISREKERSDKLLLNILPLYVANELKETESVKAKSHESVTVMFTDFKDFTKVAEQLTPEELVREINFCFSEFDRIVGRHRIEKVKTIGDAYMCAGGIPLGFNGHPVEVVNAALEIRDFMLKLREEKLAKGELCFQLRIGIATGPVVAGVVGLKKFAYDIWGDTVNVAARMESSGEPGKVNVSSTTYEEVKELFDCTYRGDIEAKNKGKISMYFVERKMNN
jgi:adenylate cyclase